MSSVHRIKGIRLITLIFLGLLSGFGLILASCSPTASFPNVSKPVLITVGPDSTPTATPFQPDLNELPTPDLENTGQVQPDFASWGDFPAPQVYPIYMQIPPPASIITQPAGQITILLLGSDKRPNDGGFRTDTMILITISADGKVSLTSFPRDLYVYIPGWMMQRLNTAYGYGGFNTTQLTFEYNFGIRPDYYVLINFDGFRSIINSLGGITVNVAQTFWDSRTGFPDGYTIYPGLVQMDSETALWYVRSRYSSSDIDRLRRAQEVLHAIGIKLFSLNALNRVSELYNAYHANVDTNLSLDGVTKLLPALNLIKDPSKISRYVIGYDQAYDWVDPGTGAQVLLPIPEEIKIVLKQALNIPNMP
jgi:LCP family protein required for cell wall assembly